MCYFVFFNEKMNEETIHNGYEFMIFTWSSGKLITNNCYFEEKKENRYSEKCAQRSTISMLASQIYLIHSAISFVCQFQRVQSHLISKLQLTFFFLIDHRTHTSSSWKWLIINKWIMNLWNKWNKINLILRISTNVVNHVVRGENLFGPSFFQIRFESHWSDDRF